MSRNEAFQNANKCPADVKEYERRARHISESLQLFYNGHINRAELDEQLNRYTHLPGAIELPWPGPLYGFLRRVAQYSKESARETADEEGAHFRKAHELGRHPKIVIEVIAELDETGRPIDQKRAICVHVLSSLLGLADADIEHVIREISLAPETPSAQDLALLRKDS